METGLLSLLSSYYGHGAWGWGRVFYVSVINVLQTPGNGGSSNMFVQKLTVSLAK